MSDVIAHGNATIKHLNIRKEGPDDEKVLALDIKFSECHCSIATLARILGANSQAEVQSAFWDEEGEPRFLGLEPISSWTNIRGCTVEMLGLTMRGAHVRKFKVRINGESAAEMEFSVSMTSPPEKATPILAEHVMESVVIKVTKEQGELDLAGSDIDRETGEITDIGSPPELYEGDYADPLYDEAVRTVREENRASISMLQRHLNTGYNRSARMIEAMEHNGIVSSMARDGSRTVIASDLLEGGDA